MKRIATLLVLMFVMLTASISGAAPSGERLFNQKCIMCHIVNGKGGAIGPELTKIGLRMGDAQIRVKMAYPKKSNPSTTMPSFQTLSGPEFDAIATYTRNLK